MSRFDQHFAELPLVAILRGISPDEVVPVASVLIDEGFRLIEIPLNSPEPFDSIARLAARAGDEATVGAGTVLTVKEVEMVRQSGGQMVVSPNCDASVIRRTRELGMESLPGFRTATEAFAAIAAGARKLKFFPCSLQSAGEIGAINSVLPRDAAILAVGGVDASNAAAFRRAGARGLGLGSALYGAGKDLEAIRGDARAIVAAWRSAPA